MPPELLASLSEQSYTCVEGTTSLSLPQEISDLGEGFQLAVGEACPGMALNITASNSKADLEVGFSPSASCKPFSSVPFAVDASVIALNIPDVSSLNLDAATLGAIYSGQVTNWSAPEVASLNPDFELPDLQIVLSPGPSAETNLLLQEWMLRATGTSEPDFGVAKNFDPTALPVGAISVMPFSVAFYNSLIVATVIVGEDIYTDFALPDLGGIGAAASQWVVSKTPNSVAVTLDASKTVVAPEGFDTSPNPYQSIYSVNMFLCGEDTLAKRAMARFLLRQDQQGSLASSSMLNLPEAIRAESLTLVSFGLPDPVLPQELIDELSQ